MFTSTNAGIGASVTTSLAAVLAAGALAVGLTADGFAAASQDVDAGVQATAEIDATLTLEAQGETDLPGPYLWVDGEGAVEIDDGHIDSEVHFEGEGAYERTDETPEGDEAPMNDESGDETTETDDSNDDSSDAPEDEETFEVAAAGSITVTLDAEGSISVTDITENAGYEAYVIGWIGDTLIIEFHSTSEIVTALLGEVDGELTYELHAEATAEAEAESTTG